MYQNGNPEIVDYLLSQDFVLPNQLLLKNYNVPEKANKSASTIITDIPYRREVENNCRNPVYC
ncbi:MAG: hypothetical protein ACTHKC_07525 [Candidatus Nitrosocosmicus sp.]